MKTLRSISIIAMLTLAVAIQATSGEFKTNPKNQVISVNVIDAMSDPDLSAAIHSQVSYDMFSVEQQTYSINVTLGNFNYNVWGTKQQWLWFLSPGVQNLGTERRSVRVY